MSRSTIVSNTDDIIDSRDVIARIEELEGIEAPDDADTEELRVLKALADEGEGCANWRHGETLIRVDYFEQYARELAEDVDAVNNDATWPNNCIDWERAASELQQDYTSIEFDGVTYWMRS